MRSKSLCNSCKYVKYFDVPQNYDDAIGGEFYVREMQVMREDLGKLRGKPISDAELQASIAVYNENRRALRDLYAYPLLYLFHKTEIYH